MAEEKKKRNRGKKEEKSLKEAVEALSKKRKIVLAFSLALLVILLLFAFVFTFIDAVTPDEITEDDYSLLLSRLDGRTWKIKSGDEKTLSSSLYSFLPESALSEKSGETLLLVFQGGSEEHSVYFSYRDGSISGFIGSELYVLYYTENSKGGARTISLLGTGNKITLYEE